MAPCGFASGRRAMRKSASKSALSEPVRMNDCGEGWHELITDHAHAGRLIASF